jgi:serine/threonine-protein kinase
MVRLDDGSTELAEILVGQMLTEYKITGKLGQGGMATVFKAVQTTLKRPAAIKILSPQMAQDTALLARFHQEAISAANLEHPHIVPIYEVDEAQGYHFIAMKYIDGDSLKRIIAREGRLALSRVQSLVDQIAEALDYAHGRGFVHRDVKPSNVMVTVEDYAYLMDFGLSRAVVSSQLTVAGTVMGTPDYMSPEQAQGDEDIDRRTDIYSLGAMLYEMLTGQVPFHGLSPAAVIMAQITQPSQSVLVSHLDLPDEVDAVIQRAMAKERSERYETAGELAIALRSVIRET